MVSGKKKVLFLTSFLLVDDVDRGILQFVVMDDWLDPFLGRLSLLFLRLVPNKLPQVVTLD